MTKALLHELGKSLSFGRLSLKAKVLWPMLLAASDDQGRGIAEADAVKWYVCPNVPEISIGDMPDLLGEMVSQGMILLYQCGRDCAVYQVVRWWEYQSLRWARPSHYEPPKGWTDRIRYSNRGDIHLENWDTPGGLSVTYEPPTPTDNCTDNCTDNSRDNQPNLTNLTKKTQTADGFFPPDEQTDIPSNEQEQTLPEEKSILEFTDPLSMALEVKRRDGGKKSWTVTGPEGANPYEYEPLRAFCELIHFPEVPPPKKRTSWGRKLQKIAELWDADPEIVTEAIREIPKSDDHGWRSFTSPFTPTFEDALGVMIARVRNGNARDPPEPQILYTDLDATPEWMRGRPDG